MKSASPEGLVLATAKVNDLDNRSNSPTGPATTTHPRRRPIGTLTEPLKVAEFWKNRRGESVRVSLSTFEGHNLVDVRQFFTGDDGKMLPTKKGIALAILRLPELIDALAKALSKARELDMIEPSADSQGELR